MGLHGTAVGEAYAYALHVDEAVDDEVKARIGH